VLVQYLIQCLCVCIPSPNLIQRIRFIREKLETLAKADRMWVQKRDITVDGKDCLLLVNLILNFHLVSILSAHDISIGLIG